MTQWVGWYQQLYNGEAYALQFQRNSLDRALQQVFRPEGMRAAEAITKALLPNGPGTNATATHTEVAPGQPFDLYSHGGVRQINLITDINRNTTAADATELVAIINSGPAIARAVDKSGSYKNGDPRFVG